MLEHEEEPGLGNGGLGRLAACFMDSLATLQIPAIGYGIRYEFGIFEQVIKDGWQVETTDTGCAIGNPWEVRRAQACAYDGQVRRPYRALYRRRTAACACAGCRTRSSMAWPIDTPILGYGVNTVNLLRLWKAEAAESFDFQAFNAATTTARSMRKVRSETISKVLYPNDEPEIGKELRLKQQYFFVSCSLQDMIAASSTPPACR